VSTPDREVARLAPAKLNLFLEVLARRPDGFHEVDTLLVALDRGDALRARLGAQPAGGGQVALRLGGPAATPDVPSDRTNLAVRAAEGVLALASGPPRSLWLELEKRVPSQAGLGGGSSDAVAAALASAELLGLSPEDPRLRALVADLGSDCPFFLEARATGLARCAGRGELVTPLAVALPWAFAVLVPRERSPTAAVYARVRLPASRGAGGSRAAFDPAALARGGLEEARGLLFNRLEEAALAAVPPLVAWREGLDESGARHFRMSGSGSAFFGLFADEAVAGAALAELEVRLRRRDLALRAGFVARPIAAGPARVESK
jgi:4-diphosphocytidyl-2-C-methyl-D-erythritol kinase